MAFEDKEYKKDANFLFKLERHIKQYMFFWIIIESAIIALLVLTIMAMLPLKQNVPYLVFFSNAENNFVRVEAGNLDIRSEEALLKSILASYVQKRETINRIDDEARFEDVRDQSSHKVWDTFRRIVTQENSIYQNKDIYREIHILNLSVLSKNVANVDFISITTDTKNKALKRYRATLKYDFVNQQISFESVPRNPTGFIVEDYALTEVFIDDQSQPQEKSK
ncbi:Type IV secretion system protein [Helicobacter fennelliae]|uniref:Type IV secretion system protein n=1 Tax=Helicobacter fennelliae TaxID=215 RepID=A0A2X3DYH9_9HELI|nr:VirB8/TrbF family protein [Helicobacter fennelliae]SQC36312.1 Type IV secretion system protein [Helicobacter fennelliae]